MWRLVLTFLLWLCFCSFTQDTEPGSLSNWNPPDTRGDLSSFLNCPKLPEGVMGTMKSALWVVSPWLKPCAMGIRWSGVGMGHFLAQRAYSGDLAILSTVPGKRFNFLFYLVAFVALPVCIDPVLLSSFSWYWCCFNNKNTWTTLCSTPSSRQPQTCHQREKNLVWGA